MTINYGYKPSRRDPRDYIYSQHVGLTYGAPLNIPSSYLPKRDFLRNQGQFGTCGGHAGAYKGDEHFGGDLSPLYTYVKAKQLEGNTDEGVQPVSIAQVLTKFGVCKEVFFPYSQLTDVHNLPSIPAEAEQDAATHKATSYAKVQTVDEIKHSIASGQPVLLGVLVTDSFVNAKGGMIPLPEGSWLGGHLILGDGYDDNMVYTYDDNHTEKGFVRFRNSWGEEWGDKGYGWIPYSFFTYTNSDFPIHYFLEGWSVVAPNPVPAQLEADEIKIQVNNDHVQIDGREVISDALPKLENGRLLAPIRLIAETFGLTVTWDEATQTATIRRENI